MKTRSVLPLDVLHQRILSKVCVNEVTGCWSWQEALHRDGYGVFWDGRSSRQAHRVSYSVFVGDIPLGMFVCHKCDNRRCVNPAHLFLGTASDNTNDAKKKGRLAKGELHGMFGRGDLCANAKGERNNMAKLTEAEVVEILASDASMVSLAAKYGVQYQAIYKIKRGLRWAHIQDAR